MFSVTHNMFQNTLWEGYAQYSAEFENYPKLKAYAMTLDREFAGFIDSRP